MSEYRKRSHLSTFLKRDHKSALFKEAVQGIAKLIEAEGLDVAECAIAEATAEPRSEAFAKKHGVKLSSVLPCLRRVAGGNHGGTEEHVKSPQCKAPGSDHATLWLKDG